MEAGNRSKSLGWGVHLYNLFTSLVAVFNYSIHVKTFDFQYKSIHRVRSRFGAQNHPIH